MHILRTELGNFRQHGLLVVAVIEVGTVIKADTVEGRHQTQVHMVFHLLAAQREQLFNQIGPGDDGGAGIESEAVLCVYIGASTCHVQLFKNLNLVAFDAQANRRSQSTKAAADDDGATRLLRHFVDASLVSRLESVHAGSPWLGSATGTGNSGEEVSLR